MKRIALLVCGLALVVCNTAEARRSRRSTGSYYAPVTQTVAPAAQAVAPAAPAVAPATQQVAPASHTALKPVTTDPAAVNYSTATAQGVANLMAAYNRVGHWGGNPGYEGCGCGATPAAAYAICCYGNSGMATVDVGYAQGANGMWYCCRRYR